MRSRNRVQRRGRRLILAAVVLLAVFVVLDSPAVRASASPSPPLPGSIAAIGDSITQAVDACCSYGSHPEYSWSAGASYPASGVYSHYERILAYNRSIFGHVYNDAVSGAKVAAMGTQVQEAISRHAQYVTVLIGGDDVCTSTISAMTPTAAFQSAFQSAMSELESGLPADAHIFVSSIPNIYELWQVLHNDPAAQFIWSAAHICQSMLSSSNTESDRQQVLAQEEADNSVLGQVCQQYANCRWDNLATFDHPFTPAQISTLDYFHPSLSGQAQLASVTWGASWWSTLGPPTARGYWLAGADGGIFSFGDAPFLGSVPGLGIRVGNVVGIAPTPDGRGYWLAGADGGIFSFGDAPFLGSVPGLGIRVGNVVGIAPTPDGGGYWLAGADGGIFSLGDAAFFGSVPGLGIRVGNVAGIAPTPDGRGYWLAGADGGIFSFGDAPFLGSLPAQGVRTSDVRAMAVS